MSVLAHYEPWMVNVCDGKNAENEQLLVLAITNFLQLFWQHTIDNFEHQ
jgi:hypothetical protein